MKIASISFWVASIFTFCVSELSIGSGIRPVLETTYSKASFNQTLPLPLPLEARAKEIVSEEHRVARSIVRIPESVDDFIFLTQHSNGHSSEETGKEKLYLGQFKGDKTNGYDVTDTDIALFEDGMIIFPSSNDISMIREFGYEEEVRSFMSDEYYNKSFFKDPYKGTHTARKSLQAFMSDHDLSMKYAFVHSSFFSGRLTDNVMTFYINKARNTASLSGKLSSNIAFAISLLKQEFPDVNMIILDQILGSDHVEVVMDAGVLLHSYGMKTKVTSDSRVYSAGVVLYWSGIEQWFQRGATLVAHGASITDLRTGEKKEWLFFKHQISDYLKALGAHSLVEQRMLELKPDQYHAFTPAEIEEAGGHVYAEDFAPGNQPSDS